MAKMGASKRTALRLAVYIRCLGGEPLPFAHTDYRAYATVLQHQYDGLRLTLDPGTVQEARTAGRLLIRRKSLAVAAANSLLTISPDPSTGDGQQSTGSTMMLAKAASTEISGRSATVEAECGNQRKARRLRAKDAWNCRRKIRHSNYLSALHHASSLGHEGLNIYPCDLCNGLHVGNDPSSEAVQRRRKVTKKLNSIAKRLKVLDWEKRQLEDQRRALIAEQGAGFAVQETLEMGLKDAESPLADFYTLFVQYGQKHHTIFDHNISK